MESAFGRPCNEDEGIEPGAVFTVVTAYEDFDSGRSAKKTYDYLVSHLGDQCEFNNRMWKFEVLSLPKLREMATRDAMEADIVIVACTGADLPEPVKAWIADWLSEGTNAMALVALLREDSEQSQQTALYLRSVAKLAGIEFFCQPDIWCENAAAAASWDTSPRSGRALSALAGVVRRDVAPLRWGLNE